MESYDAATDRAREALRWFVAAPELSLLHVRSEAGLRDVLLREINDAQLAPHSDCPFLFLEAPAGDPDDGDAWKLALGEIDEEFEALRAEAAVESPPIELPALPAVAPTEPNFAAVAARLEAAATSAKGRLPGLVVVLAPGVVTDPAAWLSAVRQLVTAARLNPLRWVVLDCTQADPAPLTEGLERRFEQVDATPDPKAALQLLNGLIAGMKSAPAGCGAQRLSGMPGPAEAPPRRKGQAPDNPSAVLDKLSDNGLAGLADAPLMQHLRIATLEAASAFADGDPSSGIRHQTDARDLCVEAGLLELASVFELSLGAHLLQAGAPEQSLTVFDQAAERARSAGAPQVVVQALMARAGALMLLQRPLDAAAAYASGGAFAAEHAGVPALLTIECWRMQGQIFMGLGRQDDATQALRRALAVATDAPSVERVGSSAPLAARDLAKLYASHGLSAQSNALLEQAERWDTELPEVAPSPALGSESPS